MNVTDLSANPTGCIRGASTMDQEREGQDARRRRAGCLATARHALWRGLESHFVLPALFANGPLNPAAVSALMSFLSCVSMMLASSDVRALS